MSLLKGFYYLIRGFGLIFKPRLRRFVVLPLLVNVLFISVALWYGYERYAGFFGWINTYFPGWLLRWLAWLIVPVLLGAILSLFSFVFTILTNLVASFFNGILAAEVEQYLTGSKPSSAPIAGSFRNELEKLAYFSLRVIWFPIAFFIPGLNAVIAPVWFLFCAWMMAVEYADFPMANHGLHGKGVRLVLKRNWGRSMGFGVAVMVMTLTPVLNFFAMPAAVAGATIMWLEIQGDEDARREEEVSLL